MLSGAEKLYKQVYSQLESIHIEYEELLGSHVQNTELDRAQIEARKRNLREQLLKIEEYRERVEDYRKAAERQLKSLNHATIVPRELNFNKLRNWAMMVGSADPDEYGDDPYARRIHYLCKCNLAYLNDKESDFTRKLEVLESYGSNLEASSQTLTELEEARRSELVAKCREVISGNTFSDFSEFIRKADGQRRNTELLLGHIGFGPLGDSVGIGRCAKKLPVLKECKGLVSTKLEGLYDGGSDYVFLPVEHNAADEVIISVKCASSKVLHEKLYAGIQNYIIDMLANERIGARTFHFFDAIHYNNGALGLLRKLESTYVFGAVPRSSDQIEDELKGIVSTFSDIDDVLGIEDSVAAYNANHDNDDRITRQVIVAIGYPSAFTPESRSYIERILFNHERYGVTVILVDFTSGEKSRTAEGVVDAIAGNIIKIEMKPRCQTISLDGLPECFFDWYSPHRIEGSEGVPEDVVARIADAEKKRNIIGNIYTNRFAMKRADGYRRGKRTIKDLPFGVKSDDGVDTISLDNENFAAFLMGASGSGKSSLLHTLIAGLLREYHPDDVELWLADFKMAEFAQYITPMPPHIKYILLDESPELVYDLVDKLNEEMLSRQRYFMRTGKKFEDTADVYMPMIVVLFDEFSIMSQAVAESQQHKLKLQNLLAKGRALGFKFIFASQTFIKGVGGLTNTAKDQIQMRIAMKNSYDEINESLALSSNTRTDQVKNWMEALPPHYTLTKYRDGDVMRVKRLRTMYFEGKGSEAFAPMRELIEELNSMQAVEDVQEGQQLDSLSVDSYVAKHPVVVDGNSYKSFKQVQNDFEAWIRKQKSDEAASFGDEVYINVGAPRLLDAVHPISICPELGENILLITSSEQACSASVVYSCILSFNLQEGKTTILAHSRDRIFGTYRGIWNGCGALSNLQEIIDKLKEIRAAIEAGDNADELIVLLGAERILSEFDFYEQSDAVGYRSYAEKHDLLKGIQFVSEEESKKAPSLRERMKQGEVPKKTAKETERQDGTITPKMPELANVGNYAGKQNSGEQTEKTDPRALLDFILRNGSRHGKHLLLVFSSVAALSQCKVRLDMFRHRASFAVSPEDSQRLFSKRAAASSLPEHICLYSDTLRNFSFRPFVHEVITWEDWSIDEDGNAMNYT